MNGRSLAAACGAGFLAVFLGATHRGTLTLLALASTALCCCVLAVAVWHLALANERIESLLRVTTASGERLSALASGRVDGESAEWANQLIGGYLWPRLITPLVERDVHREVSAKLKELMEHRNDPDTAARVPDFISAIEVQKFALGACSPVVTAVRSVSASDAARCVGLPADASDARVFDVDIAISTEEVDVVLRAFVGGGVLQALDWMGHVAGVLQPRGTPADAAAALLAAQSQPPVNTSLAIHVRRLDFSARLRVALRPGADLLLFGIMASPPPRCRIGLDVRVQSRQGPPVSLPLSRVPGIPAFLEAIVLREIASAIRWPHAVPRDLRGALQAALLPPGAAKPLERLPSCAMRVTLLSVSLAEAEKSEKADAAEPLRGPLLCIVATDGGKRRELAVDVAGQSAKPHGDAMSVAITPAAAAQDVGETLTFVLRRPPDPTRRLGAVRDAAEGLAKVFGDRARAAAAAAAGEAPSSSAAPPALLESPTLGVGKLRMARLACGTVLLLTPAGAAPALLAVTPGGGPDDATRARGLHSVSDLPSAALLEVELFPPGNGGAGAAPSGTLRVRVELEWSAQA